MDRNFVRIAGPTTVISCLLCGLGIWAAWNVQRQQVTTSELITREVHGMADVQDLYLDMREIRNHLQEFLRSDDRRELAAIVTLSESTRRRLDEVMQLNRPAGEKEILMTVKSGVDQFTTEFDDLYADQSLPLESVRMRVGNLLDTILTPKILKPAREFVELNRLVVDRTNVSNRHITQQTRQAFLLLGICGGAAGLVAGLAIARGVSRSIVELDVTIQGVAGQLNDVLGPVTIRKVGGLRELESGLQELQDHIGTLVERLQQRELEVLRSEQLAAVGQLAAGMAHELRNPLMPMKILVQAALERDDDRGLTGQSLQVVDQEIARLEIAIQEFLDFARPPSLQKTSLDLRELIQRTCELVSARADRQQVELTEVLPDSPVRLEVDETQFRQVMLNLLLNALDAQPAGGSVEVRLKDRGGSAGQSPEAIVVQVADNGPGIDPKILNRLFEPFVSTKETGTGLGLSICKRIVEAHSGTIVAVGLKPHGTEFVISLPA